MFLADGRQTMERVVGLHAAGGLRQKQRVLQPESGSGGRGDELQSAVRSHRD